MAIWFPVFNWFYRGHRDLDTVPTAEYSDFRLLDGFSFFRLTRLHINVRIFSATHELAQTKPEWVLYLQFTIG